MGLGGILTAQEVANWLRISLSDFIAWHETPGKAPRHFHIGDRMRWREADLTAWMVVRPALVLEACEQCAGEDDCGSLADEQSSIVA